MLTNYLNNLRNLCVGTIVGLMIGNSAIAKLTEMDDSLLYRQIDTTIELELPKQTHQHPLIDLEAKVNEIIVTKYQTKYRLSYEDVVWYTNAIAFASFIEDVPVEKIIALVATESSFNHLAVSSVGAIGPAQVLPKYWQDNPYNVYNGEQNIMAGARILKQYKSQCGNWNCAFRSYNVGITAYLNGSQREAEKRYLKKINKQLVAMGRESV